MDFVWPCFLAVFPRLINAVDCATQLRGRLHKRIRTGVNQGEFLVAPDGCAGSDSTFAKWLMEQSEPGGLCISAVGGNHITSRIHDDEIGQGKAPVWRSILFPALQWTGLLAYFLGWWYLIYWKTSYFATHGSYPCWPQWLCG